MSNVTEIDPSKQNIQTLRQKHRDQYARDCKKAKRSFSSEDGDRWWPGTEPTTKKRLEE